MSPDRVSSTASRSFFFFSFEKLYHAHVHAPVRASRVHVNACTTNTTAQLVPWCRTAAAKQQKQHNGGWVMQPDQAAAPSRHFSAPDISFPSFVIYEPLARCHVPRQQHAKPPLPCATPSKSRFARSLPCGHQPVIISD